MLRSLLTGLPVIVACVFLQAAFVAFSLREYRRAMGAPRTLSTPHLEIWVLAMVMLLMLLGNMVQTAIWAVLFWLLGEFNFSTALYFSGVTFATLGYGDIVMSERWRLLSSIEAANGILMFGVSTSVMTAATMDFIKRQSDRSSKKQRPTPGQEE